MALDDPKYILQLARADVLSLPPSPGDWSVHVRHPDADGSETEDHDMGGHGGDDGPARNLSAGEGGNPARRKSPMSDTQSPDDADLQSSTHSPRATKAPRVHSRRSSQETGPQTWIQQSPATTPDRARRQATASRVPQPQLGPQYYRMALVSAIQPSFGTSFETEESRREQEEEMQGRHRGDSAAQTEWKWKDDGDGRTAPGQGGR